MWLLLTFFSSSGPFVMARMMASDNFPLMLSIIFSMPYSVLIEWCHSFSNASATFVHGLSNTPTYCARQPLQIRKQANTWNMQMWIITIDRMNDWNCMNWGLKRFLFLLSFSRMEYHPERMCQTINVCLEEKKKSNNNNDMLKRLCKMAEKVLPHHIQTITVAWLRMVSTKSAALCTIIHFH